MRIPKGGRLTVDAGKALSPAGDPLLRHPYELTTPSNFTLELAALEEPQLFSPRHRGEFVAVNRRVDRRAPAHAGEEYVTHLLRPGYSSLKLSQGQCVADYWGMQ